jgi:hypothetical protein
MSAVSFCTGSDLRFDAERHEYRLPDDRVVPNVTSILRATGVSVDFEEISTLSSKLRDAIDYRRALGTAVHADCHAFDDNDLDWSAVHDAVKPYVEAWTVFREQKNLQPRARERRVFHPGDFYCGTLDGLFEQPNGRLVLVDIKIGDPHDAAAHLQTAAYLAAYEHEAALVTNAERWAVRLIPERRIPYDIVQYSNWQDINKFRAVLTTFYEQPARRARSAR